MMNKIDQYIADLGLEISSEEPAEDILGEEIIDAGDIEEASTGNC